MRSVWFSCIHPIKRFKRLITKYELEICKEFLCRKLTNHSSHIFSFLFRMSINDIPIRLKGINICFHKLGKERDARRNRARNTRPQIKRGNSCISEFLDYGC